MKFENKIIDFKPRPLSENPELRKRLLEKKVKMVDNYRPKEADFSDIYSKDEINRDLEEIKHLKELWTKDDEDEKYIKDVSSIYEGVIADQIEANAWFGEDCEVVLTSEYDDIKNGVDMVSVFNKNESKQYLGLGIDVTFASDKKILDKKLDSIKQCIKNGTLPILKYFQDPDTGEHKKLSLPKVIIGSRLSSAEKLIQLWGGNDENKNKKLKENPIQSKIILESLYQLKYFYDYATKLSDNEHNKTLVEQYKNTASEYAKMYNNFYDLYESKKDLINKHSNEISDDIVYETILEYTGNKKKE